MEAIVAANNAARGRPAPIDPRPYDGELPLAALTCIDPRLNHLFPRCLGLADDDFIWLRNAGNVITGPATSTVRSVAMSVFLKKAREIAVIGHSDCRMAQIGVNDLVDRMKARGISRGSLPIANMHEFFGLFSNERANVIKGVGFLRTSPVIPHDAPIHGLLIDTPTGRLEWVINGYETTAAPLQAHGTPEQMSAPYAPGPVPSVGHRSQSPHR